MTKIAAIPTTYKNVRFRSRLESNWARWLDDQEIVWSYEPEGFKIGGVWYLPDFYLPEINTIIEVKGVIQGLEKAYALFEAIQKLNYNEAIKEWYRLDAKERKDWYQAHFAESQVYSFPKYLRARDSFSKYLFLLGGSPVPALYNIHETSWYCYGICSDCHHSWICTCEDSYTCRICGVHHGDHDVEALWFSEYPLLKPPLEWIKLKEEKTGEQY